MSILDTIRAESPEWDVLAVDIADKNDGVLYLIVIRRRVGESGNMILSERYFRYDVEEDSGTYLSNGIERRVTGALGAALRVLYSATTNGDTDPDDPMLMDSRGDGLSYNPEELTEPVETLTDSSIDPDVPVDARSVEEDDPVSLSEPERESWVRCKRCGGTLPEEDAVLFSEGPPLGDIWIHSDGCPEEEDNEDPEVRTDGGRDVEDGLVCHYCGESYTPTTSLERSYADDEDAHDVCSSCLFDVITDDETIDPLPRFVGETEVDS